MLYLVTEKSRRDLLVKQNSFLKRSINEGAVLWVSFGCNKFIITSVAPLFAILNLRSLSSKQRTVPIRYKTKLGTKNRILDHYKIRSFIFNNSTLLEFLITAALFRHGPLYIYKSFSFILFNFDLMLWLKAKKCFTHFLHTGCNFSIICHWIWNP